MFGRAAFFARADLSFLDACGAKDVIGRFLKFFSGDEFAFSVVARAWNTESNTIATIRKRSVASYLLMAR